MYTVTIVDDDELETWDEDVAEQLLTLVTKECHVGVGITANNSRQTTGEQFSLELPTESNQRQRSGDVNIAISKCAYK